MFKAITTKREKKIFKYSATVIGLVALFLCSLGFADDGTAIESFSVVGQKESLPTKPGSAHILSPEELKKFQYDDINRALRAVPGVNIQEEDGFGLRPNIGLRGAHPHRSKKITLMEDGVLIAPAPYSAPAAYYFPHMDKISSIEVFKGMPSVKFGPNSIGGAMNMLTRINDSGIEADISGGSFDYRKYDLSLGLYSFGDFTLDMTHVAHGGFKTLPGNEETGFQRNNVMLRWDKYFVPFDQSLTIKLNWSDEESHETYLGLTNSDFKNDPFQRYSASQDDLMRWKHKQFFINYGLTPFVNTRFKTTLYHHELDRSWFKVNGFFDDTIDISEVLKNPTLAANNQFYKVLRGDSDSLLSGNRDRIRKTTNARSYANQGVQFKLDYELEGYEWDHLFSVGYRLHQDEIDRDHVSQFFAMQNNDLVLDQSIPIELEKQNVSKAQANTVTLAYETTWDRLFIQTAARLEDISYEEFNELNLEQTESSDNIFAPGMGVFYQAFNGGGFLLGVHKGFTPVGPGQASNIKPEEAMNYELGVRYSGSFGVELIGFYSDYTNILGTCTQSSGCAVSNLDQRFNGGEAEILGAELLLTKDFKSGAFTFPVKANATYTEAQFKTQFDTTLPDWGSGTVNPGDPVPYIPEVQGNLTLGVQWKDLSGFLNYNYLGKMADQAVALNREYVDSRWVLDFSSRYNISPKSQVYFKADNITGEEYGVSYRPQGLRPGKAQSFIVGLKYAFFR